MMFGRASVRAAGVARTASSATMTTTPTAVTSVARRLHRERLVAIGTSGRHRTSNRLRGRVAPSDARLARSGDRPAPARGDPEPPSQPARGAHRGADRTALAGGFGRQIGKWITSGFQNIAPVAAMFVFAILFFGVMTDAGLLDPIVARVRARASAPGPRGSSRLGAARAARAPRRVRRGDVSRRRPGDAAALRARSAWTAACWPASRRMAAGVILPALGRADAARVGGAADPGRRDLQPAGAGAGRRLLFVFGVAWWLGRREERRLARTRAGTGVAVAARR